MGPSGLNAPRAELASAAATARKWDTRVESTDFKVPRIRDGGFILSLLDSRKRADQALIAVVQEASIHGASTRRVDELVKALGMMGIS